MIDIHTHLWDCEAMPESIRAYFVQGKETTDTKKYSAEGLLDSMSQAGIEYSVVSALAYSHELPRDTINQIKSLLNKT